MTRPPVSWHRVGYLVVIIVLMLAPTQILHNGHRLVVHKLDSREVRTMITVEQLIVALADMPMQAIVEISVDNEEPVEVLTLPVNNQRLDGTECAIMEVRYRK